jgi:Lrp/AsnC family leucine-responsive transcriptional regulator
VLDEKDARILRELERDCRQRTNQIAKQTNLPITTCHNRIKKLSASGHIAHFRAVLNPEKLGKPLLSFVFATLNRGPHNHSNHTNDSAVLARIASHPCVQEAHKVSGDWDVLLKIRTGSVRELNDFISETLQGQQLIDRAQTYVAMETHKETTNLIYNGKR